MYYYFSASSPCVVKINGIYHGEIQKEVKFIKIEGTSPFVELCPLNEVGSGINFILNDEFLSSPPHPLSVTDMGGGYLIRYQKIDKSGVFNLINQQKYNNALITVFSERGKKVSIETAYSVYLEDIEFPFSSVKIAPFFDNSDYYVLAFIDKETLINVYSIKKETKKVLSFTASEFNFDDMTFITYYKDMAKHAVKERLFLDSDIKRETISLNRKKELSIYALNERVIPYAMLEELFVGGNIIDYLSGTILENKDKLKSFFGDYIGVMPPPFFRKEEEVGLIYKIKDNLYKVEYFTFTLTGKKINGIKKDA